MGEVATLTVSTVAVTWASQKKRALTACARRSARLMDGGQTLGGDTSGTWRTEGVVSGGDEAFTVFGTSTSGGTHVSTERRWGARSGAGAARGRQGLVIVWRRRAALTGDLLGGGTFSLSTSWESCCFDRRGGGAFSLSSV